MLLFFGMFLKTSPPESSLRQLLSSCGMVFKTSGYSTLVIFVRDNKIRKFLSQSRFTSQKWYRAAKWDEQVDVRGARLEDRSAYPAIACQERRSRSTQSSSREKSSRKVEKTRPGFEGRQMNARARQLTQRRLITACAVTLSALSSRARVEPRFRNGRASRADWKLGYRSSARGSSPRRCSRVRARRTCTQPWQPEERLAH